MRILLVEDDAETARFIIRGLQQQGHVCDHAADGHDGLMMGVGSAYDVLVLDRMLPKLDGFSLLKSLREAGVNAPAILLTALGSVDERVNGLQVADDYLVKPFAFAELYARIVSLARRTGAHEGAATAIHVADVSIDLLRRTVTRQETGIPLQPTEFRLLEYLMRHAGQLVTRTMLLEHVWNFHFDPKTNIVETHISRLRTKLDKGFDTPRIKTIRGAGYVFTDAD